MNLPDSCMDCPNHRVERDPDPTDWFCDDDVAVLCSKEPNVKKETRWSGGMLWPHRPATTSCRPYNMKRETSPVPKWCPLRKEPAVRQPVD